MGDYCKLIVSCSVKGTIKDELKVKIEELGLHDSAYHSQEKIVSIEPGDWDHSKDDLNIILVGQTKWGSGQPEFCEWLRPYVVQGSGLNNVYAMQLSEYSDAPHIWKLGNLEP